MILPMIIYKFNLFIISDFYMCIKMIHVQMLDLQVVAIK